MINKMFTMDVRNQQTLKEVLKFDYAKARKYLSVFFCMLLKNIITLIFQYIDITMNNIYQYN